MEGIIRTNQQRQRRKGRTRAKITGTASRPRLSVFRSNRYLYVQLIDDQRGCTLAAARGETPTEVGTVLGEQAVKLGIHSFALDRGSYRYQGQIKRLAETVRQAGIKL